MKQTEYAQMAEQERTYWWHKGRARIIESYLENTAAGPRKSKILNVGCGTGGTVTLLERYGVVDNVDTSDVALAFMKQGGYRRLTKVTGTTLPFADKTYDLVVAFDVLEHIKDENKALREWSRVLKDTGAVVLTVPAYQWLWSGHDVALGHQRRYTIKRLVAAAKQARLSADKKSYAIVFSLPLVVGFRLLHSVWRKKDSATASYVRIPGWINTLFAGFLYAEARLHGKVYFPAGTSVVAVFRKIRDH